MPPSRHSGVHRPIRAQWILLGTILAGIAGLIAWRTFIRGDFTPRFTATLLEHSWTNDIGYTVWIGSADSSGQSVFLSSKPAPQLMGERHIIQVRTNQTIRRLRFQIVNTGREAVRQCTARRQWYGLDWQIDGEWLPERDSAWFLFRDDLILPGEARSLEFFLPEDATAIRLRWLAQPASTLYRLAWKYPPAFKTAPGKLLGRLLESDDPESTEVFLTSDPIPLNALPGNRESLELR